MSDPSVRFPSKFLPFVAVLLSSAAEAIKIEIDYSYDTNGFFDQPGSKEALRAVADFYESLLHDQLARIDVSEWPGGTTWSAEISHPGTGAQLLIPNLIVPANTLVIYAGGRSLGGPAGAGGPGGYQATGTQAFLNLVAARGQSGALATPETDFGPWGGVVVFDQNLAWDFSTTGAPNGMVPFLSIALHEVGHLLGLGLAPSWHAKISSGVFTGPNAVNAYGGNVPVQSGGGHWRDDGVCQFPDGYDPSNPNNVLSDAFGSFGSPHGRAQIGLMDPQLCSVGDYHKVMTDLDLAALRDIGWEVAPPTRWLTADVQPPSPVAFSWPSTSNITYRVERSTTLEVDDWETVSGPHEGDGSVQSFIDPNPPKGMAFYRLNTLSLLAPLRLAPLAGTSAPSSAPPLMSNDCEVMQTCCP